MSNVVENLIAEFGIKHHLTPAFYLNNPIGVEIEIKWRDYFPQLWEKYLKNSPYSSLSLEKQTELTKECNKEEEILLPKLNKTITCGIPRGSDKYWEFAFNPSYNVSELIDQVETLQKTGLIPKGNHSLHVTLGNMKLTEDAYYLLLLLELHYINEDRIMSAFNKQNQKISASWARKGMGGLFLKDARELAFNSSCAIELRTLELSKNHSIKEVLLKTCFWSEIIIDKQNQITNSKVDIWNQLLFEMKQIVKSYNLTDENWKKPNIDPTVWLSYVNSFSTIKKEIIELEYAIVNKSSQKNKIR